jgi:hypothetical protein
MIYEKGLKNLNSPLFLRNPTNIHVVITHLYETAGMKLSDPVFFEIESKDYGACRFGLDKRAILFRVGKTTPTKVGQFVTLWKRQHPDHPIEPFSEHDPIDFIIISTSDGVHHGQFIFDSNTLIKKGIFSSQTQNGKRAIRVYPPWSNPTASEAIKTQKWQLRFFVDVSKTINLVRIQELLRYPLIAKPL